MWARSFECARAVRSLVCMPCFMLERGVRIPPLMSWVSVSDTHAPRSVSLWECAVSRSLGPMLFCPRVFCCVARSLCIVMLLFFFVSSFLMTFEFENIGRHRDCHGAQSIRKEILERQANEKKSRHKKLELMKDTKEQQTRLLHYTKQLQQQQTELDNIRSETHRWVKIYTHI